MENDAERQVKTPWFDHEIPFTQAATIGTKKVIHEHATIGIVVTADGEFWGAKAGELRCTGGKNDSRAAVDRETVHCACQYTEAI